MKNAASLAQFVAADPAASTWLAANAGSGKTKVLIDRVARLLLRQVDPVRILCLTYTRAAATEMQIRLFDRLGKWAMLPADDLRKALAELDFEGEISAETIADARRLFARALETPGGLKIQTIHSFCASLLRRFPLEAGVSPQFAEMDDRSARLLRDDVLAEMADGAQLPLIDAMARMVRGDSLDGIATAIAASREYFAAPLTRDQALELVGLPSGYQDEDCWALGFDGSEQALFRRVLPVLLKTTSTMVDLANRLAPLDLDPPTSATMEVLFAALLKKDGQPNFNKVPTTNAGKALGPLLEEFHAFMQRIADVKESLLALAAAEKTLNLHRFAAGFLPEYAGRKLARGWLDFDDLILKARDLLTDPARAQWVLFRLDGGIDHILVDEAQDTGPVQWQVISRLAEEFHTGQSARQVPRTIFVVGDKKQSIYSFQGADLRAFDQMRGHFALRLRDVQITLADLKLAHSFRSSPAILHLVDRTLQGAKGLGEEMQHLAFFPDQPGRVDLWPIAEAEAKPDAIPFHQPDDLIARHDAATALAEALASEIKAMLVRGTMIKSRGTVRRLQPGDIIILLQSRSALFHALIRACKAKDLPIAGADRLKLAAEIAVRDLTALMQFLALPEDDLALAEALRSPLLGLTEAELYHVAQPRGKAGLWQALRGMADRFPETLALLHDLRDQADFLRPYELAERILTRQNGRKKLLARLGPEAEDGIDAFLQQALAYERMNIPSLSGFLAWLSADEIAIKRQGDASGRLIRVMTVHGAKGLEAPVVILPDTNAGPPPLRDAFLTMNAPKTAVWNTGDASPVAVREMREAEKEAEAEERLRLLYVAMTRAENWLIVAARPKADTQKNQTAWYDLIEQGFSAVSAMPGMVQSAIHHESGPIRRLSWGDWPVDAGPAVATATAPQSQSLPGWANAPPPTPPDRLVPLSPSGLGGAKVLPGEPSVADQAAGKLYGSRLHILMEHLPGAIVANWPELARTLLAAQDEPATPDQADALLEEARAILAEPALAWLFAPDTLAEAGIAASLAELDGRRIVGAIDRLVVDPGRVLAVDYKSNMLVPERAEQVPDGLLRQMGAYAAALAQIWPGRRIEVAILWTRTGSLMPLPHDLVMAALRSTTLP